MEGLERKAWVDIHICEQERKKASVILPPPHPQPAYWAKEQRAADLGKEPSWPLPQTELLNQAGALQTQKHSERQDIWMSWTTCTGGLLQLPRRNRNTPFWSFGVGWACCKMSFILNLNMGKMSLISSINMKTCHQETMTIKTGEEDGDQEETFAVNYSDVRNVRLVLVAHLAVGSFNPTKH